METSSDSDTYSWRLYHRVHEAWEAMYRDCEQATTSIEFEQYIFENDAVGHRFLELFIDKAAQGLKVFVICDMFGSILLYRSPLVKKLRRQGGCLHFYNALSGWNILTPWRWFPRTHIKTLLIDSKVAYAGGVCIAERMRHWRDTHVRITGPVIAQIRHAFDDIENRILRKRTNGIPKVRKERRFLYFLNRPWQEKYAVYKEMLKAVRNAKRYIYITTAFFIPNRYFLHMLKQARQRGVEVIVLMPERSDVLLADWICLSYIPRYLKAGLRLFHYRETVLHSKTAIIDDNWGTVGSTNFDIISFFYNREANIMITDPDAIAELKRQFSSDLQCSTELTWERWRNDIPLWKKMAGYVGRIIKAFF